MGPLVRPAGFFLGYCLSLLACAISRARDRSPREFSHIAADILLAEANCCLRGIELRQSAGESLAAHRLCKLAGPKPSCSSVLVPQFCTECPQADRNRSATKHERDTGSLALCHSPVAGPSPRRNKGSKSVSPLPQPLRKNRIPEAATFLQRQSHPARRTSGRSQRARFV